MFIARIIPGMAHGELWLDHVARRIGGPRVLALGLLRGLAVLAGFMWVVLAPSDHAGWGPVQTVLLGFLAYSAALMASLWRWPHRTLQLNLLVVTVDLVFALLLIHLTGGTRSVLFLALLLIAGVQAYYHGYGYGVGVALVAAAAYVGVVWPTLDHVEAANTLIRVVVLIGTAVGVGVLAQVEERERLAVARLSSDGVAETRTAGAFSMWARTTAMSRAL